MGPALSPSKKVEGQRATFKHLPTRQSPLSHTDMYLALLGAMKLPYSKGETEHAGEMDPSRMVPAVLRSGGSASPPLPHGTAHAGPGKLVGERDYSPFSSPPYSAFQETLHLATNQAIKRHLFTQPKHFKRLLYQPVLSVHCVSVAEATCFHPPRGATSTNVTCHNNGPDSLWV